MANSNSITAEYVRRLFNYDPDTGIFTRIVSVGSRGQEGMQVGSADLHGYKTVRIEKRSYKIHRLAWLYVHGAWPVGDIDHINGNRSDNRIVNLRDVTRAVNLQNQRRATNNRSTGVLGVYKAENGRFNTKISINNKCVDLGTFDTLEEARDTYIAAKRKHHAGCTL